MPEPFRPFLSHYTDRAGLEGLARSKSFWATNFLDLNDTSEFTYAWAIIARDAAELALQNLPASLRRRDFDLDAAAQENAVAMREMFKASTGYDNLYSTSFARAHTEDQDRRGILTIWDRYTKHEGYCLQYNRRQIEHLLELDAMRASYGVVGITEVGYGVDKETSSYRELCFQMGHDMMRQIAVSQPDVDIQPAWEKMWAQSYLGQKLFEFCATHKDPCYEDEREFRIFAFPAARAEARVLTGIAGRKEIRRAASGKRYIVLGEHWTPGIEPVRIIIGEKARKDVEVITAMFTRPPEIAFANMPVA